MSFASFFENKKLMVCVGTGGVGKTTSVAGLGIQAALMGQRVLVITVDPSQRLAATLGLRRDTSRVTKVMGNFSGSLHGVVVHPSEVFDEFLKATVETQEEVERLLKNRLYYQLKTRLSGSQEFTSLEVLHRYYHSGEYDLIILDTPPAQNAIDFLEAPEKLYALFDSSVTKWFLNTNPDSGFLKKLLLSGSERALHSLQLLTGREFINELIEFFHLAQGWRKELSRRMQEVQKLFSSSSTSFVLVTAYDETKLLEARDFERVLKRKGYRMDTVVINKVAPSWLSEKSSLEREPSDSAQKLKNTMIGFFEDRKKHLEEFHAKSEHQFAIQMPDLVGEVSDMGDLIELMGRMSVSARG